ncbi:tyrosine-type recombinase/integrase [Actinokineospora enzanensis]|uniref:tyrosine-type recombinase/integrase n=1 Tax=Actinokineospora enzanensis TaxID=155975 RepID=UPI001469E0A5|nr:tyrosine-type recombinase/integrase [Actinokineospora enzanensis]
MSEFDDWRDEWELVLRSTVSAGTRTVYLRSVNQFVAWLRESSPEAEVSGLIRRHIDGWAAYLADDLKLAGATRRVRLLAVRFWLDYIVGQPDSGLDSNPASKVRLPVAEEKPVPIISDEDLTALLRTCDTSFVGLRDEAILRLFLDTGSRRAEIAGTDVDDLDLRAQEVTVTGKGNKTRVSSFGSKTAIALRKYMRARARRPGVDSKALFLSARPHASGEVRLTGGGIGEMFTRRCVLAGLSHMWPHMMRHTWAHDMLDNGANEGVVEKLGGWAPGSKMVKRYGSSMAEARARKAARMMARGDRV